MNATAAKKRDLTAERYAMVERQIVRRGVRDELVLEAVRSVPREAFLPEDMREFAYEDSPLPIEEGQTISQPYIVALMTEALLLNGGEKVLEIGTGSGYAAAVLAQIAAEVYTVERIGQLADKAAATLTATAIDNVHVLHGDGTLGWPRARAIRRDHRRGRRARGSGGAEEPAEDRRPAGDTRGPSRELQELVRVTRVAEHEYEVEELLDVRFVPLVGAEGWAPDGPTTADAAAQGAAAETRRYRAREGDRFVVETFTDIESADLEAAAGPHR